MQPGLPGSPTGNATPPPPGSSFDPLGPDQVTPLPPDAVGPYGPQPTASEAPVTAVGGPADGSSGGANPGGPGGRPPDSPVGGPGAGGPSASDATWGPLTGALSALGITSPSFSGFSLAPTLVTTTGAVAMAMAFGIFGKRRRDGNPPAPDAQLAAAAAAGIGAMVLPPMSDIEAAEAMMPRWRRPSLLQARKADPIRDATPSPRLSFDHGLVGPLDGRERRLIRYRAVRMLDTPDELRGTETGYLDRGDEVQLLEKYGAYWLVLCPDGRQGWVHNMTLGDVVDEHVQADRAVATMPLAADTWTMGESDDDTNVLETYLDARRREP